MDGTSPGASLVVDVYQLEAEHLVLVALANENAATCSMSEESAVRSMVGVKDTHAGAAMANV